MKYLYSKKHISYDSTVLFYQNTFVKWKIGLTSTFAYNAKVFSFISIVVPFFIYWLPPTIPPTSMLLLFTGDRAGATLSA